MTALAASSDASLAADLYGEGELLERFEARIAAELGKPAAVFMPSGTLAQQIALRIWSERAGIETVAMHPTAHPIVHESNALEFVQRLRIAPVGSALRLMTSDDLAALAEPASALLVELPQREIGAQLPGARLWEATPHYARPHAEIAALFDSVYVSFYKGLDAIAGAALAGDAEFIAEARLWQHRLGGRLVALYPLALSAEAGFETYLPRMAHYREVARAIAAALAPLEGVEIVPDPPQTNTFHIYLRGTSEHLKARAEVLEKERGIRAFRRLAPTVLPTLWRWEFVVGEATLDFTPAEIAELVRALVSSDEA